MKKFLLTPIFFFFFLFATSLLHASHYMGGEITWECIPAGQPNAGKYIFEMKVYRECAGIQFGTTQTLMSNSPAGNISMTLAPGWPKDISPVCNSNSSFQHITCAAATTSNTGAIEEYIYRSQPIQLNGTPPATGWMFYWGSCCRNPSNNILTANSRSWRLRAIMYPYGTQNTYPCYDNSPTFAERPRTVVPTGNSSFNSLAYDAEQDSITYEWGQPLLSTGAPLSPYISGYSFQNPLPDSTKNPANVAAVVDSSNGLVTFTSYTTGAYVTSIKVTSYRAGIKIAEIWRDLQVVITASGQNSPPQITPPFSNGQSFTKTVFVGDTVTFSIGASDLGFLPNGSPQNLSLELFGDEFGTYIPATGNTPSTMSSTAGCKTPPCATLTPAPCPNNPLTSTSGIQTQFEWVTSCAHLYSSAGGYQGMSIYRFVVISQDDFCPVPAVTAKIISINVVDRPPLPATDFNSVSFDYDSMNVVLNWQKPNDPHNQFDAYYLYYSNTPNGPFSLLDSVMDINTTHAVIHTGPITKGYFYLRVKSHTHCIPDTLSAPSAVYTLNLTAIEDMVKRDGFYLLQNRPNPATQHTVVEYIMKDAKPVEFQLITLDGKLIERRKIQSEPGLNKIDIDLSSLKAGVYYYSIQSGGIKKTAKMVVLKK